MSQPHMAQAMFGVETAFAGSTLSNAFTTDASGNSGPLWLYIQPTGNSTRFGPGQQHNLRVGFVAAGGTMPTNPIFIGSKIMTALDIATTPLTAETTDDGAFIYGLSGAAYNGKYAIVYNNEAGTGDPLFTYQARQAAATNTTQSQLPTSINDVYMQVGSSVAGDFPAVVPIGANNPNGVRRIEFRNADNTLIDALTNSTGDWGVGANTAAIVRREVMNINVASAPGITVTPTTLTGFNTDPANPSATQTFVVSGEFLTANVFLAAPANYEISLAAASGYTTPIELTQTSGTLALDYYICPSENRIALGTYNGEVINVTSAGATPQTVTCNGSVTVPSPDQLTVDPVVLTGFTYAIDNGGPSISKYYTLSGSSLTGFPGVITVTGSTNYEVSNDEINWGPAATVDFSAATLDATVVFVRLKAGLPEGNYNGELITNSGGGAPDVTVTCSGTVTPPQPTATCVLRPSHIDLTLNTSQSAVLMSLSNYPSDLVRYKIYLGGVQYYCWDESLDIYQTSSSTGSGPLAPGTPTSSSSFWILYQRGTNISGDASYRDRISPYSADFKTISLTSSTSITTPFSLTGNFVPFGGYDNTIKHVVLAYSSSVLISATSTTLSTGAFALVCPDGTTIDLIEVRAIDNTLIASRTGSWSTTSVVGNVPDLPIVAVPVISPVTGNYYAPFSATITCTTPASSIYYTTDGTDPDNVGNGTLYTIPVPVSATTTLKAKAYATDFDPSIVVTEVYTFPVVTDVANIAALRAGLTDGTAYRLTGEAVLTFKSITRNAKYIQDATGAIIIDDNTGKITTTYNLYDGITGITGTLSLNNLMLQFVPVIDPGAASSTGNTIVPESVSLVNLNTTHQAKLVKVNYTTITGTGNFAAVANYPLTDPSGTGVMRTHYADLNYIGTAIPAAPQNLTGVVLQFGSTMQLIPRGLSDFEVSVDPSLTATPNTLSGFVYAAGNGPSSFTELFARRQ